MAEFIAERDILVGDWAGLTPISKVFSVPPGMMTWSIHIVPKDSGPAGDPNILMEYGVGSEFFPINPPANLAAPVNQDSVVTRSDAVNKIRITVTPSVAVPDGNVLPVDPNSVSVLLRLLGSR